MAIDNNIKTTPTAIRRIFNILVSPNSASGKDCRASAVPEILLDVMSAVFELLSVFKSVLDTELLSFVVFSSETISLLVLVVLESTKFEDKFMSIFTAKQFVVKKKNTHTKITKNIFKYLLIIN